MLKRNFDVAAIGPNLYSFLYSIELKRHGLDVLLLDVNLPKKQEIHELGLKLTLLELQYLKKWGEARGVLPLANIEDYAISHPLEFIFGKTRLLLGRDVFSNLLELARKVWPSLTAFVAEKDPKELEHHFLEFVSDFCTKLLSGQYLGAKNLREFFIKAPASLVALSELMEPLASEFKVQKNNHELDYQDFWEKKSLLLLGRSFYDWILCSNASSLEIYHLALSFLTPAYLVDEKRLLKDCADYFKSLGGEIKNSQINTLSFYKNGPWDIELESFEGVIHLFHLSFFEENLRLLGSLNNEGELYSVLEWQLSFPKGETLITKGKRLLFSGPEQIGSFMPILEAMSLDEHLFGVIYCKKELAAKSSFYLTEVKDFLQFSLTKFLSRDLILKADWNSLKINIKNEIRTSEDNHKMFFKKRVNSVFKKHSFVKKISQRDYFGPLNAHPLGPLSLLLDIQSQIRPKVKDMEKLNS